MIVYKIRRKSDGLFSTGGTTPRFTSKGKTWSGMGQIKNHLNQFVTHDYTNKKLLARYYPYEGCELVEFVISEEERKIDDLKKIVNESLDRKSKESYYQNNKFEVIKLS